MVQSNMMIMMPAVIFVAAAAVFAISCADAQILMDPPNPLNMTFEKEYEIRNFFNSKVVTTKLDLSLGDDDIEIDDTRYPKSHLTESKCIFEQQRDLALFIRNPNTFLAESYIGIGQVHNYLAIDLDIESQSYNSTAILALLQDNNSNRILVSQKNVGNSTTTTTTSTLLSIEIFKNGTSVLSRDYYTGLNAPNTLRVHLTGVYFNVLVVKGKDWRRAATLDISPYFDFRDKQVANSFTINAGAKLGENESIKISRLEEYLTSGTAQADPKVVHYENGAPMIDGYRIWFAMTTRGYGPIPSSYQGVYLYDLEKETWQVTGTMGFSRGDNLIRPYHASDVFYDRNDGMWKVFTTSHGDSPHMIYSGQTDKDLRFGYNEISVTKVNYAFVGKNEDASVIYDEQAGMWRMGFAKMSPGGFSTALLESQTWNGRYEELSLYQPTSGTGILIQKIGGTRYVFLGRGRYPCPMEVLSYPDLKKQGELILDTHPGGGNVWPVIIPITFDAGTAYYMLTFDRSGLFGGWSYGDIYWYHHNNLFLGFHEYLLERSSKPPLHWSIPSSAPIGNPSLPTPTQTNVLALISSE